MSLSFAGAQWLNNTSPPITDYPITVGCWVRPAAAGNVFRSIWQLSKAGDPSDRFALYQWTGSVWCALVSVSGADTALTAGTVTATSWHFLVARFISATNRRLAVLNVNGSTAHAQSTTSAQPLTQAEEALGANVTGGDPYTGLLAEFWRTNTDIQVDAAQLSDSTLRQLAYGGPFSVPNIAGTILEYRSFRKHPYRDEAGEVYYGGKGVLTWTPTSTPTTGFHPPLPYWYRKPVDAAPLKLMI
jgi:hypothetical protein